MEITMPISLLIFHQTKSLLKRLLIVAKKFVDIFDELVCVGKFVGNHRQLFYRKKLLAGLSSLMFSDENLSISRIIDGIWAISDVYFRRQRHIF